MAAPEKLTGKQTRHLRALAHSLKPIVQVGKHGWTDAVRDQINQALTDHELIKVRVGSESPTELKEFAAQATKALSAQLAQTIGNIALLYRRHPDEPKIQLPRGK
jgi:RNA-binding protein